MTETSAIQKWCKVQSSGSKWSAHEKIMEKDQLWPFFVLFFFLDQVDNLFLAQRHAQVSARQDRMMDMTVVRCLMTQSGYNPSWRVSSLSALPRPFNSWRNVPRRVRSSNQVHVCLFRPSKTSLSDLRVSVLAETPSSGWMKTVTCQETPARLLKASSSDLALGTWVSFSSWCGVSAG